MLIANSHPDLPEHQVADHGDYFPNFADTVRELFFPQYIQHYLRQDKIALSEQNRFNLFSFFNSHESHLMKYTSSGYCL